MTPLRDRLRNLHLRIPRLAEAVACATIVAFIQFRLIIRDPVLQRDDEHILAHLRTAGDIFELLRRGRLDQLVVLQPLRDLSLSADLAARKLLGFGTFHLTNSAIFVVSLLLAGSVTRAFLARLGVSRERAQGIAWATLLFLAAHPALASSVAWISARKHLLAALFILAATRTLLKGTCRIAPWRALALYGAAILSHPIGILWPAWAALYLALEASREERRRFGPAIGLALTAMTAGALANFLFYSGEYERLTAAAKLARGTGAGTGLLALGRYGFNWAFPFRVAAAYYPGSVFNLLGIPILGALTIFVTRAIGPRRAAVWLCLPLVPLLPVTLWMTNIFVSDSYAILSVIGWTIALAGAVATRGPRQAKWMIPVGSTIGAGLIALAYAQAGTWRSDEELWRQAFTTEPSPRALALHARHLIDRGQTREALALADRLHEWDPADPDAVYLAARATFNDRELPLAARLKLLEELGERDGGRDRDHPWRLYFEGSLQAVLDHGDRAVDRFSRALLRPDLLGDELSVVAAEAELLCRSAAVARCSSVRERLAELHAHRNWNESRFADRLAKAP